MRVVILTAVLAAVLSVDAKQTIGTQRSVCLNEPDGTYVADEASCSNFFICYQGEAVSQACIPGSYFDKENLYCLPDVDDICPQPECSTNGEFSPHPNNCSMFYVCYDGKLVEQSCGNGSYFDKENLYCLPDNDNICPQPQCSVDGAFSANPTNCSMFYVCYQGQLVEQSCGNGSYFDREKLYCLPDTENICPGLECNVDGAFSPHPTDCSLFYICYNGKLVQQKCEAGSYFDKTNLYCLPDKDNICPQAQCAVDGAFSPHPTECALFYVCYNGLLVEQTCGNGSYFDKTNLYCLPDTDNICWPSTPSSTPEPCTCVGGYTNGEFVANPDSCYSYYVCSDGELVEQNCGYGNYFENSTKQCERDITGECWPNTTTMPTTSEPCKCVGEYEEGELIASPDKCYSFYVCTQGELIEQNCGYGNYFDNTTKTCERDTDGECWTTSTTEPTTTTESSNCTCLGGYKEGDLIPNSDSCSSYFVCTQGELIANSCGFGNYFDSSSKTCVRDENGVCWTTTTTPAAPCLCPGGYEEGDLIPNSESCSSYFVCTQGELIANSCGSGNYFDSSSKTCVRDVNGVCWTTTTTPAAPCLCPGGYEEGDLIPNSDSCSSYFVCTQGELIANSCGSGNYFDSSSKTCVRDENGVCWTTTTTPAAPCLCPGGYEEGDLIPNSDSCSSYFVCTQGELIANSCGSGNYFDSSSKKCVRDVNGVCWTTTTTPAAPCLCPGGYEEGDLIPNSDSCSSYFVCTQGELIANSCGSGNYFDSSSKTCVRDVNGVCWTTTTTPAAPCLCPGGYEEGDLIPNSESCSSYFVCTQGELIANSCGSGNYFDSSSKTCVRDVNGVCWTTTTTPAAPCLCPGGYEEGDLIPNSDSCSSYFVCTQGELIANSCGFGNYFDSSSNTCVRDENGVCWTTTTTPAAPCLCPGGYEEGDLIPNSDSCSSYFVCTQGELIANSCGSGKYFDSSSKTCVRDVNGVCWTTTTTPASPCLCPGGYEDGDLIPNPDSCYMFFICFNGELVEESCGNGNYFDKESKNCVVDSTGVCWPVTSTTSTTVKTTPSTATPSTTTASTTTSSTTTPSTTTKSTTTPLTTTPSTTQVPCTCPGGYEDGDLIPNPDSCYMFFICFNGELVEESCGNGNYFEKESKSCVVDSTGVCWPVTSSTSTTIKTTPSTATPSTTTASTTTSSTTTPSTTTKSTTTPPTTTLSTTQVPCTCPGGYEDGDLIPNPDSCYMFFICFNGELVEESCGNGNYFDKESKSCVVDSTGVCWPVTSSTSTTIKTTPSTATPSTTTASTTTSSTTTPSTTTKSTTTPPTTTLSTTQVPCTCPGGYEDGDLIPNPDSCYMFFICFNGELVEESCGNGNYFDKESKSCALDSTGVCWPVTSSTSTTIKTTPSTATPSTTTASTTTSSTTTPSTTTKSTTTPPTTTLSTTQVPCTCPGGYEDGDLIPNPDSCYMFFICFNGELVEESCGNGNYFDKESKSCALDSTGVCWPVTSSTSTTIKTTPSTATPSTTTASTTTSSTTTPSTTTKSTTTPPTTTLSTTQVPCTCPGGYEDGDLIPNPDSCYMFFICFNGELVEESCGNGNYFDKESKSCVLDSTGVCWPVTSSTSTTIKTTPSTATPSTTSASTTTSSTTAPSTTTKSTTTPPTTTLSTTQVPCTCPGGYEDGDLIPNPDSCYMFFICFNGELVEESCGNGNYFDKESKSCVLDSTGVCWPVTSSTSTTIKTTPSTATPSTTTASTTTSSTTTPSTTTKSTTTPPTTTLSTTQVPCTCPGGYEDGDFVPYPGSCYIFQICYQGVLIEESCGMGNYFDVESKSCIVDTNGVCWPIASSSTSTSSTTTPSTTTPSTTIASTTPSTITPSTTIPSTSTTTPSTTTPSTTQAPCKCPGGYDDGEFIKSPDSCYIFYICYKGELIEESCGKGNYFDGDTKSCILDTNGVCWPIASSSTSTSSTTTISTTTPSTTTRSTTNSSTTTPPSTLPSSTTPSTTTPSTTTTSTATTSTTTRSTTTPSTTLSTTTPSTTTLSTTQAPCICPGGFEDGEFVKSPDSCYIFYICYKGELIEESCGKGNYFDAESKSCVSDKTGLCWPLVSSSTSTSSTTSLATTTRSTTTPSMATPSTTIPTTNTPSTTTSSSTMPSITTHSTTTLSTTTPPTTTLSTFAPCSCPGGYQDGEFIPKPDSCYLFNVCYQGELVEVSCGYGNYFDETTKSCVLDSTGVCWPKSTSSSTTTRSTTTSSTTTPSTTTSSTTTPSTTTPSTTTPSTTTPSTTMPSTTTPSTSAPCSCPGGYQDGEFIPKPDSCYLFNVCYQGELVEVSCGYGNYFDETTKSCVLDSTGVCWPKSTSSSTTSRSTTTSSTTTPSTTTSSTTTPSTTIPSTTTPSTTTPSTTMPSTTTPSTSAPCSCLGGYQDGEFIPKPDSCYLFNVCYQGELVEVSCGYGNYFDETTKSCVLDSTGVCWPKSTSSSTTTRSTTTSSTTTPSTTTSSTTTPSTTTPSTTTPSTTTPSTTMPSTTTPSTSAPCSCPGGYQDGEFIPKPDSCYLFNVCYQGELVEVSCGYGNYFDETTKSCVLDSTEVCWPKSSSSSTTTRSTTTSSTTTPSTTTSSTTTPSTTTPSTTTPSTTTPSTTMSSTTTPSTSAPCSCPGGYQDGEFIPKPDSCYLFSVCYQGELVEVSCGFGNYFDETTKSCVLDTAGVCWSKSTSSSTKLPITSTTTPIPCTCPGGYENGDFVPHPDSCSLFYVCYQGELSEMSCGVGNYFNSDTNSCNLDTTGICWTKSTSSSTSTSTTAASSACPNGKQEGDFIANPSSCYLYYICNDGELMEGNCGTFNYFNNKTNLCEPDVTGLCWPTKPTPTPQPKPCECSNGLTEGQFIASPSACYLYYICDGGDLVEGNCGTGNYFNNSTRLCEPDTTGRCWPVKPTPTPETTPCECPNGLKEGQFMANPSSCYLYYICNDGELMEGNCGTFNYFNNKTNLCEPDVTGLCWPAKPTPTPEPKPCECSNGLTEGQFIASPSACYLYYICDGGDLVEGNCGTGNYFNNSTRLCEPDTTGRCWPVKPTPTPETTPCECPNGLKEGQFMANPSSCYLYYICNDGELTEGNCGTFNYFNNKTNLCEPDVTGLCWPAKPTPTPQPKPCECSNGLTEGQFIASPSACYLYYICDGGDLVEGNCGTGNYFNNSTRLCEPDASGYCWPVKPTPSPEPEPCECPNGLTEGQFIASPSACYLYYICSSGELVEGNCGAGNYFNNSTRLCEPDTTGRCWPVKPTPTPETTPCECPNGLKEGQFMANPSSCYLYYICNDGELTEGNCGTFNYFNNKTNLCEPDVTGLCWPAKPTPTPEPKPCECSNGLTEGQFIASPSACYLYYICDGGDLVEGNCGTGNYFNNSTRLCEPDASGYCWPVKPTPSPEPEPCECPNGLTEGQFIASPSACYLYYICSSGELVEGNCGAGNYFNNDTKICQPDTTGCCWPVKPIPPSACPDGLKEGQLIANPSSCYLYNICYQGQLVGGNCGTGNYFNSDTKLCEPDTTGCCRPVNPTPCDCPNGLQEGQFIPNPSACSLYYICSSGELVEGNCGTGNYFNNETKLCAPDSSGSCWPVNPPPCECLNGLQEGQFIASPSACYLYNICYQGELVEGNCGTGNYFNNDTKMCEPDTGGCCWPKDTTCPGGYTNGEFVPNLEQCDQFFICYDGVLVEQECGVGYFFDNDNKYCTRDINGTCWAAQVSNNTCDGAADGTYLPNEMACDKFFICYNNSKIPQECGIGNVFNSASLTCSHDTLGLCWKKVTNVCANQITGTFVQNPSNCQEFYVCHSNRAVLQQCGNGYWFNPNLMICQPDLNATCVNVCQGTNVTTQLPHPNCNQFYTCANGLTTGVGTCPSGTNYDATLGVCRTSVICEANLCASSTNGVVFPVQNDVTSFYSCYNKIPLRLSCPDGTSFDQDRLICIPDTGRCIGQKSGYTVASHKNPNAFYVCRNNMAIFEQCPSYAVFDEKRGVCVHAQRKRLANNVCVGEPDGAMLLADACNKFNLCLDGETIEQNCGAYSSFSQKLGYCVFNLSCYDQNEICAKSADIEKFPDARYETSFIKCKRGLAVIEKCPKNMIYSHDIGYCVPREMAMSEDELDELCANAADNTMAPALDCRKFYICRNNVAILQQCAIDQHFDVKTATCLPDVERQCWMRSETLRRSFFLKSVCHEGLIRADRSDCAQFEVCTNGVWTREACPRLHYFDSRDKVCVPGDASKMCLTERSGVVMECLDDMPPRPFEKICTDYYRCVKNQWKLTRCPVGEFFNSKMASCTKDASACARIQDETHCSSNETRASNTSCGLFQICYEGEWWYRHCEEGAYFNKSLKTCLPNDGTCRLISETGPCRNGTVMMSDFDPCIVYHLCVDGNWTVQHCPSGHHFNETRKACMLDDDDRLCQNEIKNVSSSCVEGDRRFQPLNCTAFDICSFGQWMSVPCRSGFYFDTSLQMCIINRGECSADGLMRRDCIDNTSRANEKNCKQFYYCSRNAWHLDSCLEGFQYNATIDKCVPTNSSCAVKDLSNWIHNKCVDVKSGWYISHETDCTKYYLCVDDMAIEAKCSLGKFYDDESKSCQLNDGTCPLKMIADDNICQGKSNGSQVRNPANCTTFYICNGTIALLSYCPPGQYFNADIGACQIDTGICNKPRRCDDNPDGYLPHETYCNIYYACVRGTAIPVACEEDEIFDLISRKCSPDVEHRCIDGHLVVDEICTKTANGRPIVDIDDCTKYIVCSNGVAQTLQCPPGQFFDADLMFCITDDGSCPYVDGTDVPNNSIIPPDPISCIGKHGDLMPDPEHCNEFYMCIYGNLRHDRCFDGEFFDINTYSCTPMLADSKCRTAGEMSLLCATSGDGTNFADQTDCRKFYQCNDGELQSKKCRTGESFDALLSFCRQNDGTCLLENGQRVGACAGKHGKLAANAENCRGFFTCINGQKISEECENGEYFDKLMSACVKDVNSTCRPVEEEFANATQLSCNGLTELVFYPNILDDCRTFFQCVKGTPRVHKCPDDLLFNGESGICDWKDYVKCIDMTEHHKKDELCVNANDGTRYENTEDNCDSYFICTDGKLKNFKCDPGLKYNVKVEKCDLAANVNCTITVPN